MKNNQEQRQNYPILAIHSTDNSFGFGYRKNNEIDSDEIFIKKFDNDLCNNLIIDLNEFISKETLHKVNKISGMDITFVTNTNSDKEAKALLTDLGLPFKK